MGFWSSARLRSRVSAVGRAVFEVLAPAEGEEWLVGLVVLLLLLAAARHRLEPWLQGVAGEPPPAVTEALEEVDPDRFGRVDLNLAGAEELETLPRIGPRLAARILEDRRAHGPFVAVEDLDRVPGIGPHTIAELRDAVYVEPTGAPPPAPSPLPPARGSRPRPGGGARRQARSSAGDQRWRRIGR